MAAPGWTPRPAVPLATADGDAQRGFARAQRRRGSIGVTAGGAALRPEIFERMWSAHASTASWQRSFVPINTTAVLGSSDRDAVRDAFAADCRATERADALRAEAASPGRPDRVTAGHSSNHQPADSASSPSVRQGTSAAAAIATIPVTNDGARRVREIIARAINLSWLASVDTVLQYMKTVALNLGIASMGMRNQESNSTESTFSDDLDWEKVSLDVDAVMVIAEAIRAEAGSRRAIRLQVPLGNPGGSQEDPYAAPDEVAIAFASLGGSSADLSGQANFHATAALLAQACVDDHAIQSAARRSTNSGSGSATTTSELTRRRRPSDAGSDASDVTHRTAASRVDPQGEHPYGATLPPLDDDDEPGIDFKDFQTLAAVDPWKATAARIFVTLGGDASNPTSTVSRERVQNAYERMLSIELPQGMVQAFLHRFDLTVGDAESINFEMFDSIVIVTLRRVCSGAISAGDASANARTGDGGGGQAHSGSAGLLQMLTYQPTFGNKTVTTKGILQRVDELMSTAKKNREDYRRIRNKTSQLFRYACVLQRTPLSHLVHLTRRRLLFFVNMITQRRTFNLSAPNSTIERFLRCLAAAAVILKDHGVQCKHCIAVAEAIKPTVRVFDKGRTQPAPAVDGDGAVGATAVDRRTPHAESRNLSPIQQQSNTTKKVPSSVCGAALQKSSNQPRPPAMKMKPWTTTGARGALDSIVEAPVRTPRQPQTVSAVLSAGSSSRTESQFVRSLFKRKQLETQPSALERPVQQPTARGPSTPRAAPRETKGRALL